MKNLKIPVKEDKEDLIDSQRKNSISNRTGNTDLTDTDLNLVEKSSRVSRQSTNRSGFESGPGVKNLNIHFMKAMDDLNTKNKDSDKSHDNYEQEKNKNDPKTPKKSSKNTKNKNLTNDAMFEDETDIYHSLSNEKVKKYNKYVDSPECLDRMRRIEQIKSKYAESLQRIQEDENEASLGNSKNSQVFKSRKTLFMSGVSEEENGTGKSQSFFHDKRLSELYNKKINQRFFRSNDSSQHGTSSENKLIDDEESLLEFDELEKFEDEMAMIAEDEEEYEELRESMQTEENAAKDYENENEKLNESQKELNEEFESEDYYEKIDQSLRTLDENSQIKPQDNIIKGKFDNKENNEDNEDNHPCDIAYTQLSASIDEKKFGKVIESPVEKNLKIMTKTSNESVRTRHFETGNQDSVLREDPLREFDLNKLSKASKDRISLNYSSEEDILNKENQMRPRNNFIDDEKHNKKPIQSIHSIQRKKKSLPTNLKIPNQNNKKKSNKTKNQQNNIEMIEKNNLYKKGYNINKKSLKINPESKNKGVEKDLNSSRLKIKKTPEIEEKEKNIELILNKYNLKKENFFNHQHPRHISPDFSKNAFSKKNCKKTFCGEIKTNAGSKKTTGQRKENPPISSGQRLRNNSYDKPWKDNERFLHSNEKNKKEKKSKHKKMIKGKNNINNNRSINNNNINNLNNLSYAEKKINYNPNKKNSKDTENDLVRMNILEQAFERQEVVIEALLSKMDQGSLKKENCDSDHDKCFIEIKKIKIENKFLREKISEICKQRKEDQDRINELERRLNQMQGVNVTNTRRQTFSPRNLLDTFSLRNLPENFESK